VGLLAALSGCARRAPGEDRRLVLVTLDGLRWQEVFRGADEALLAGAGAGPGTLFASLRRGGPEERRRTLMPFLWETIARRGQIYGDVDGGSRVLVANPHRISYPGYHDLLCGFPSLDIASNDTIENPDLTVLEWLNDRPRFRRRVAVFASWELFPFIFNVERSGLPVDAGQGRDRSTLLNRLREEIAPPWRGSVYDAFTVQAALRHLGSHDVRVLHLALGDTDEWAHAGRYDRYLEAIHRADGWIAELWQRLEASPAFRGRTSLLVTTDHGRGATAEDWRRHSAAVTGAEEVWLATMGPLVTARGSRRDHPPVSLAQVAATAAALVGEDYRSAVPAAAPPLALDR
jgi:hypothetical protein